MKDFNFTIDQSSSVYTVSYRSVVTGVQRFKIEVDTHFGVLGSSNYVTIYLIDHQDQRLSYKEVQRRNIQDIISNAISTFNKLY